MRKPLLAVIIPFYQREAGILGRALRSIAAQSIGCGDLYVLVVDDGSPVSAIQEFSAFPPPPGLRVSVIRQTNRGPNEARNAGLDNLEPGTRWVAYLDSDDEWTPHHLERALRGLAAGCNAYFTNLFHLGDTVDEFTKARRVDPAQHPMVDADASLRIYQGDMVHQIIAANIIFMPTLVIDANALGAVRFPSGHRHGGGDYLYWLELLRQGARFAFSTVPEVRCGSGVNLWYRNGWGTDGLAMRIVDEARFRRTALLDHARAPATQKRIREQIVALQLGMVKDLLHRMRHGKPAQWSVIRMFFQENQPGPKLLLGLLRHVTSFLPGRKAGPTPRR